MSVLGKLLSGWQFRTRTPGFEPGQAVSVVLTEHDAAEGAAIARVGDSRLVVEGAGPDHVDRVVDVEITEFDEGAHTGRARLVPTSGEPSS